MKSAKIRSTLCLLRHIKAAYRAMGKVTPLPADCGNLCNSACCHTPAGAHRQYGMLLFPGEWRLLRRHPFFRVRSHKGPKGFEKQVQFAVCKGRCNRKHRPLACRIYPLIPALSQDGTVQAVPDAKAVYRCPLLQDPTSFITPEFYSAVKRAGDALRTCPALRKHLQARTEQNQDFARFTL